MIFNHDATHCFDFSEDCPESCYRAELARDLKRNEHDVLILSYAQLKDTSECELNKE